MAKKDRLTRHKRIFCDLNTKNNFTHRLPYMAARFDHFHLEQDIKALCHGNTGMIACACLGNSMNKQN